MKKQPLYTVRVIIDRWDPQDEEYYPLGEWPNALSEFNTYAQAMNFMSHLPGWRGPETILPIPTQTFGDSGT